MADAEHPRNPQPLVLTSVTDNIMTVTINRPEVRNAVDPATADALSAAFEAFDADDSLAVAVLTGQGGFFCAGADLVPSQTGAETVSSRTWPLLVQWGQRVRLSPSPS